MFLFDGEQVKELAELDIPPAAVVEAINNLLGLELAEKLAVDLSVLVNRKRKAIANKAQLLTIEEIEQKLANEKEKRRQLQDNFVAADKKLAQAHKECDLATTKFNKQGGKIAAERSVIETEIQDFNSQVEQKRQELIKLAESSLPLGLIRPLLNNAQEQAEQEVRSQQLSQAQDIIRERDDKLLNYLKNIALSEDSIDKVQFFYSNRK